MKVLLLVVVLLVASGAIAVAVSRAQVRGTLARGGARWRVVERTRMGRLVVEIAPPRGGGDAPIVVAALDPDAEDFPDAIEAARAEAQEKLVALNRPLGPG